MKGLRFERIGGDRYYNVVFHMGSTYVPVSDETIAELKTQSLLPAERFLDLLIVRIRELFLLTTHTHEDVESGGRHYRSLCLRSCLSPPHRMPSGRLCVDSLIAHGHGREVAS